MEKTTIQRIGIGAVMIGVFGYTFHYLMKQARKLVNTEFEFSKITLNSLSLEKVSITLWWKVVNKSDISVDVSNQDYDIFLNGRFIKKVGYTSPVKLKAKQTTYLPTYVVLTPKDVANIGIENALLLTNDEGQKKTTLLVKGKFTVKTSIFEVKKFPFEFEDTIYNMKNY